jgi:hypothetical protein
VLLVFFLIFSLPPFLLIRAWSRRRAKRKAAAQTAVQQTPPEAGV